MEYRQLGRTDMKVSAISFGAWAIGGTWGPVDDEESMKALHAAVDAGVNFIDTAEIYPVPPRAETQGLTETYVGSWLASRRCRDRVILATKVAGPGSWLPYLRGGGARLDRRNIEAALDASLRRLRTDYIDLYQIHRWDHETPSEETVEALHDGVKAGKARYVGASSMYAWQFAKAQHIAQSKGMLRFVSMQNHYNLIYREEEREMIPLCRDMGVALIPWSPLARGFLAGNRTPDDVSAGRTARAKSDDYAQKLYYREEDFAVVNSLSELAIQRGESNARIAYAWLLHQPGLAAPIVGASKIAHIEEAVAAIQIKLSEDEIKRLGSSYKPHTVLGHT